VYLFVAVVIACADTVVYGITCLVAFVALQLVLVVFRLYVYV
jgi:hypothetical protein